MELIQILSMLKGAPTEVVIGAGLATLIVAIVMRSRKADIENLTSIGKLQQDHLASLMLQNKQLADDLADLRQKMAAQYEITQRLREQVSDLEAEVRRYQSKCDNCPGPPPAGMAVPLRVFHQQTDQSC